MSFALILEIVDGPENGRRFILKRPMTSIGRVGTNIALSDESLLPIQAIIVIQNHDVLLVPYSEKSHTMVRRSKIPSDAISIVGEEFQLGENRFFATRSRVSDH